MCGETRWSATFYLYVIATRCVYSTYMHAYVARTHARTRSFAHAIEIGRAVSSLSTVPRSRIVTVILFPRGKRLQGTVRENVWRKFAQPLIFFSFSMRFFLGDSIKKIKRFDSRATFGKILERRAWVEGIQIIFT